MSKQAIFEGRKQILLFLRGPRMVFSNFWKHNGPIGVESLHSEPIGNNQDHNKNSVDTGYISNKY